MFHIDDASLRVRECDSSSCLLDHRKTREEGAEVLAVIKASRAYTPQDHLALDDELLRKTDALVEITSEAMRHVIPRLSFPFKLKLTFDNYGNVQSMASWVNTLEELAEGLANRRYSTHEADQARVFQGLADHALAIHRSMAPLQTRYTGWTRYWTGSKEIVHRSITCAKLLGEPRMIPQLSGIIEQKILADPTVAHCTTCFPRSDRLQGKPEAKIRIPMTGKAGRMVWSIVPAGSIWALQAQAGDEEYLEPLSNKLTKAIREDRPRWDATLQAFLPLVFHQADFSVTMEQLFLQAKGFKAWKVLKAEPLVLSRIRLLSLLKQSAELSPEERTRFVAIQELYRGARSPLAQDLPGLTIPGKSSPTEVLDLYDFLINGDNDETFAEFQREESGRVFSIQGPGGASGPGTFRTLGKNALSSYDVHLALGTIPKLMKRSPSLRSFIEGSNRLVLLDLGLLIQVGRADGVPLGALLEALESFRELRGNYPSPYDEVPTSLTAAPPARSAPSVRVAFDPPLSQEERALMKQFFNEDRAYIHDAPRLASIFFYHALHILGRKACMEFIEAIMGSTDGLRLASFMTLVSRGGFAPGVTPAFQIFGTELPQ